ncbi:hypothetical protein STEG23_017845 [Scotinomys teguina]
MDLLGQRTHCGPNVAAPNPRQPYLGDFTADGLDQLTLCSQSRGFGTPAAPVQGKPQARSKDSQIMGASVCSYSFVYWDFTADGLDQLTLCWQSPGFGTPAAPVQCTIPGETVEPPSPLQERAGHLGNIGDTGDFTADGLDQLTLCSQSPGFGTTAAPVQGHPKSVLSCRHRWPGRLFSLPNNLALSLRCRRRFQEAPLSSEQAVLLQPSPAQPSPALPSPAQAPCPSVAIPKRVGRGLHGGWARPADTLLAVAELRHTGSTCAGDFTADGLDQLTLCSQSPGFGTPAAPVQVLFKETESGQSTSVSKLTIISPDTERK